MARMMKYTAAQKQVLSQIADGMIIKKDGYGFSLRDADGQWVGKASIAVKSLARQNIIANTGSKIYFTTHGYWSWFGGAPKGEAIELCNAADERVEYVKSMLVAS